MQELLYSDFLCDIRQFIYILTYDVMCWTLLVFTNIMYNNHTIYTCMDVHVYVFIW